MFSRGPSSLTTTDGDQLHRTVRRVIRVDDRLGCHFHPLQRLCQAHRRTAYVPRGRRDVGVAEKLLHIMKSRPGLRSKRVHAGMRLAGVCDGWSWLGRFRLKLALNLVQFDAQAFPRLSQC